ncbi:hypothetical protein HDU99_007160, partial [Rhizoclosmatium hyalinum]
MPAPIETASTLTATTKPSTASVADVENSDASATTRGLSRRNNFVIRNIGEDLE